MVGVAEALAEADEELDRDAEEEERLELLTISEEETVMLAEFDEELDIVAAVEEPVAGFEEAVLAMLDEVAGAELEDKDEDDSDGVMNLNIVNLLGPPQISAALPLQGMLHNASPSGAGPPPLFKALPQ